MQRIDTHGAIIFLAGEHAFKLKRAVRFPFMDLSTVAKRREACKKEIAINKAFAPQIYLDAVPITRSGSRLELDGEGAAIDWVVRMRRFDENRTLDRVAEAGELHASLLVTTTQAVLASHRSAPRRQGLEATRSLRRYIQQNDEALRESPHLFAPEAVSELTKASELAFEASHDLLIQRGKAGFVRRCHGDLHLRNIAIIEGRPTLFDAVEFDEAIATCDVLYDLAFLLMDLWERKMEEAANAVLNRYLWDADEEAHLTGLKALPLFLSIRAALRAKISASAAPMQPIDKVATMEKEAKRYFDLARLFLEPVEPELVAIGGLSGTGKTTLATAIAPSIGRAPGAIVLRSDIERKHLAGVPETERLPACAYTSVRSAAVYDALNRKARLALGAGSSAVLDAVHARPFERDNAEIIARRAGAHFTGLWLEAATPVMVERVANRRGDASDADPAVVLAQTGYDLGRVSWHRLDADVRKERLVEEALLILAMEGEL
ncbi:AAA family ATPase [Labrys miyagiensis]|uniref:bifunctional aminoglycoside phosphotransferase/ATP-binding protein n=1 Tax=Labrys miyagiensis TaxID=346912 RepID=UPI0024E054B2|nr:bifunctional aminoglycoside phosphotransferase/ATP-binding protein [Labrys miyagiensis]